MDEKAQLKKFIQEWETILINISTKRKSIGNAVIFAMEHISKASIIVESLWKHYATIGKLTDLVNMLMSYHISIF